MQAKWSLCGYGMCMSMRSHSSGQDRGDRTGWSVANVGDGGGRECFKFSQGVLDPHPEIDPRSSGSINVPSVSWDSSVVRLQWMLLDRNFSPYGRILAKLHHSNHNTLIDLFVVIYFILFFLICVFFSFVQFRITESSFQFQSTVLNAMLAADTNQKTKRITSTNAIFRCYFEFPFVMWQRFFLVVFVFEMI